MKKTFCSAIILGMLGAINIRAASLPPTATSEPTMQQASKNDDHGLQYVNPGESATVQAGSRFSLLLSSNPTTGYKWRMLAAPDPAVAALVTNMYCPPETQRIGAGGNEKWTFQAVNEGTTNITMVYIRPWEKDTEPARHETFTIEVK